MFGSGFTAHFNGYYVFTFDLSWFFGKFNISYCSTGYRYWDPNPYNSEPFLLDPSSESIFPWSNPEPGSTLTSTVPVYAVLLQTDEEEEDKENQDEEELENQDEEVNCHLGGGRDDEEEDEQVIEALAEESEDLESRYVKF